MPQNVFDGNHNILVLPVLLLLNYLEKQFAKQLTVRTVEWCLWNLTNSLLSHFNVSDYLPKVEVFKYCFMAV